MERFAIQGTAGTSLFVVADGEVEVILRRAQGPDLKVATLGRGEVVGEMSLLTGEPRAATVRAVDGALVYEIGRPQYAPLLHAHREWVEELAMIMEERLRQTEADLDVVRRAEAATRHLPAHRPALLLDRPTACLTEPPLRPTD